MDQQELRQNTPLIRGDDGTIRIKGSRVSLEVIVRQFTQGATAEMTRAAFDENGYGAIVSASRSVLYPESRPGEDWKGAIARAAREMRDELSRL